MVLILDIGKTNKKCFVFDEDYQLVHEKSTRLPETEDEDGFPCEDLALLDRWIETSVKKILQDGRFRIRAIHCTAYGASLVHLDEAGQPLTPLYNYLKPFPEELQRQFFEAYGGEEKMALETASPVLGSLNSGLQLYRLKYHNPLVFKKIKWSLHLPQYVAYVISLVLYSPGDCQSPGEYKTSEITSIGCHTMLWDFRKHDYHDWVKAEGIAYKFPPISPIPSIPPFPPIPLGPGLHDSSAALIPYLTCFQEPFVLISTGTWCISLNPFNPEPLTPEELAQDCLCYLSYEGRPVKAARYFGGHEHDVAVKELGIQLSESLKLSESYRAFMRQLVEKQAVSTRLAIGGTSVKRIFVDGGFSNNELYMTMLAETFPEMEVFAAEIPQATAIGAAMAIHPLWNEKPLPQNLITLKKIRV